MSTSFRFSSAGRGRSLISLARSVTESDKPQEFESKVTDRIGQYVVIDSEVDDEMILSHQDEQIFKADELNYEDVQENEATTKRELEKKGAIKSNV
ncbi:MAG TPA: hypothetical protein VH415_10400 [Nitrososphaeraceae archaeon]